MLCLSYLRHKKLELDLLGSKAYVTRGEEKERLLARIEELLDANSELEMQPMDEAFARAWPRMTPLIGFYPTVRSSVITVHFER